MTPRTSSKEHYLAIDQGGHASRALVFDDQGRVVSRGLREVKERRLKPGWIEQDPEELVTSINEAVGEAIRALGDRRGRIRAGMATQRSSIVCWDRQDGKALSPVLSWQDRRAHAWLAGFSGHAERIHEKTGLYLTAHYGASKLRWCMDHLPEVRSALEKDRLLCGPLASFLSFRLLDGRPRKVDPANAARTLLWNLRELDWDAELLELFGIPREVLPDCVPTRHDFGRLGAEGEGVPLEILTGDQSAALFAHGSPAASDAYVNLGTGAFVQRVVKKTPGPLKGLLGSVVFQDENDVIYVLEGTVNGAGSALKRIGGQLGIADYEDRLRGWLKQDGHPPLYLNGVSGLGSPYWIPDFESGFVGDGEPWEKMVAGAESIVFLVWINLRCLQEIAGEFKRIVATGGLAWYDGLCQRLADLSGLPVERPAEHEATARGTAYLLARGPRRWPSGKGGDRFLPGENRTLTKRFQRWEETLLGAVDAQRKGRGVGNGDPDGKDPS